MTEKEKMLAGEWYRASDSELREAHRRALRLAREINQTTEEDVAKRKSLFRELLGRVGKTFHIEPPFRCDYGFNIFLGENFYANFDCIFLDVCAIEIGDDVLLGPRVGIYTACHPLEPEIRKSGLEFGKPVRIGNNVWIGGNSILNPGISIGDNSVIGAGSVVTKPIPAHVVAVGNPCRVLRELS